MTSSNVNMFCVTRSLCEGNPPVSGGIHSQRAVTRSFDVFFDLYLNKHLSKHSRRRCFETPSCSSWRHANDSEVHWAAVGDIYHEICTRFYCALFCFGLFDNAVWIHHDDVIEWKHFPRYWPFVRGIHWSPVNSPRKGPWRGALMFSLICTWTNGWANNRGAGDLRNQRAHYDVIVMYD